MRTRYAIAVAAGAFIAMVVVFSYTRSRGISHSDLRARGNTTKLTHVKSPATLKQSNSRKKASSGQGTTASGASTNQTSGTTGQQYKVIGLVSLYKNPVSGARIAAYHINTSDGTLQLTSTTAFTNEKGFFELNSPEVPSEYMYQATADQCAPGYGRASLETYKGQRVFVTEIVLSPWIVVAGQVVDESGSPVKNASVQINSMPTQAGSFLNQYPDTSFMTVSDQSGSFVFNKVPPGHATLAVLAGGFQPATISKDLSLDENYGPLKIVLQKEGAIVEGHVSEHGSGVGVAGAKVTLRGVVTEGHLVPVLQTLSDDVGNFRFTGVPLATYTINATKENLGIRPKGAPGELKVEKAGLISDISVIMYRGHTLTGIAVDDNKDPVQGVRVSIPQITGRIAESGKDGRFALTNIYPDDSNGWVSVRFTAPAGFRPDTTTNMPGTDVVQLRPEMNEANIKIQLLRERVIKGRVLSMTRDPIPGASVEVAHKGISTQSGVDGKFSFTISGGEYDRFVIGATGYASDTFTINMGDDLTTEIECILHAAASVAGKVVNENGTSIEDAQLDVYARPTKNSWDKVAASMTSDQSGNFLITGVPAQTNLSIVATHRDYGITPPTEITLADQEARTGLHIVMKKATRLQAWIHAEAGNNISGARVELVAPANGSGQSDEQGKVAIEGVSGAEFSAIITHPDYYTLQRKVAQWRPGFPENITMYPRRSVDVYISVVDALTSEPVSLPAGSVQIPGYGPANIAGEGVAVLNAQKTGSFESVRISCPGYWPYEANLYVAVEPFSQNNVMRVTCVLMPTSQQQPADRIELGGYEFFPI